MCPLFLGNNMQHMPVYAKMISSWKKKALGTAEIHIYLGIVQDAVLLATFVVGISLMFTLQADEWSRVSTQARQLFSAYITTTD